MATDTHDTHEWELKKENNKAQRIIISNRLKTRFPKSIPVMIEQANNSTMFLAIDGPSIDGSTVDGLKGKKKSFKYIVNGNVKFSSRFIHISKGE
jgi:hypothetical protein